MHLSVDQDCPLNRRAKVFLNGEEIQHVVECQDGEGGYVVRNRQDENGHFMIEWERDCVMTETLTGSVLIVDSRYPDLPLDKWRL